MTVAITDLKRKNKLVFFAVVITKALRSLENVFFFLLLTNGNSHFSSLSSPGMKKMCSCSKAKWWTVSNYATVIFLTSLR